MKQRTGDTLTAAVVVTLAVFGAIVVLRSGTANPPPPPRVEIAPEVVDPEDDGVWDGDPE